MYLSAISSSHGLVRASGPGFLRRTAPGPKTPETREIAPLDNLLGTKEAFQVTLSDRALQ
ncbi:MAG: hypothetical protein JRD68_09305 [Deltaproteobacteria bacterium]|nr:hypothetical protein [Deltaproteobacteria bacterium]